jgi:hypothetical protein
MARFARFARYASFIPGTQDEPLGIASLASAARLMEHILIPVQIKLDVRF